MLQKSPPSVETEGGDFFDGNGIPKVLSPHRGYCPIKVCKLQSSYICGEIKNQIKNNEAYNGTKIGNYFGNGLE